MEPLEDESFRPSFADRSAALLDVLEESKSTSIVLSAEDFCFLEEGLVGELSLVGVEECSVPESESAGLRVLSPSLIVTSLVERVGRDFDVEGVFLDGFLSFEVRFLGILSEKSEEKYLKAHF